MNRKRTSLLVIALLAGAVLLNACTSRSIDGPPPVVDLEDSVEVRITPRPEFVRVGDSLQLRAIVEDTRDTAVLWRLLFGSPGTITSGGLYIASEPYDPIRRTVNVEATVVKFPAVKTTLRFTLTP